MDAIAARAQVAVGTLYRHHPTKADLVAAVVDESVERIATEAERAAAGVANGSDPSAALADLFRRVAERYAADHAVKEAAARLGTPVPAEAGPFTTGSAASRAAEAIESILSAARDAGQVRADITLADLTVLLSGVPDAAGPRQRYVEIVLAGITAR